MDLNLQGQKVLITGIGDGIGRALALAFAAEGAQVSGCARSEDRIASLKQEMSGQNHCLLAADISEKDQLETLSLRVLQKFGGLDILINNAGLILTLGDFHQASDADWEDSFAINLLPAVRLTRLFYPALKASPSASVINISSIAATRPTPLYPHYSAMKAALSNWTLSLAQTLAKDKIRVNAVAPGPVWSRSWENEARELANQTGQDYEKTAAEIQQAAADRLLLKRMGQPEDVTGIVLFLASQRAGWITGREFVVDGGSA